jgi:hypothetical protein
MGDALSEVGGAIVDVLAAASIAWSRVDYSLLVIVKKAVIRKGCLSHNRGLFRRFGKFSSTPFRLDST